jgi:3',5'-cyclic AMP phosphodiesterase CpdA
VRFALVTDVHFGPPAYFAGRLSKLSQEAPRLLAGVVDRLNTAEHPELVVNLGDVVEDENHDVDHARYGEFVSVLSRVNAAVLHVAGNHDSINLSDTELAALWGHHERLFYARRIGGVSFVVLRTVEVKDRAVHLAEEQLAWLRDELGRLPAPVVVFMHHPASEMSLAGNRWFENAAHICRVAERRALRRILEDSGKVVAVFNGHAHWNHFDVIGGIPYVTLQSLIENLDEGPPGRPAAAWAVCELDAHRLVIDVRGEERARYQLEL